MLLVPPLAAAAALPTDDVVQSPELTAHDADPTAHPSLRTRLDAVESGASLQGALAPAPTGLAAVDTANLRAAIDRTITLFGPNGGPVYLRGSSTISYKLSATGTLRIPTAGALIGAGSGGRSVAGGEGLPDRVCTRIDATAIVSGNAIEFATAGSSQRVEGLSIKGPTSGLVRSKFGGSVAIDFGYAPINPTVRDVYIYGFCNQIVGNNAHNYLIDNVLGQGGLVHGIAMQGNSSGSILAGFANCGAGGDFRPGNILLEDALYTQIIINTMDETVGSTGIGIYGTSSDVEIQIPLMYVNASPPGVGIRIGDGTNVCKRIRVIGTHLEPYAAEEGCRGIIIAANAQDTILEDVTTSRFASGRNLSDDGLRTVYRNVNGQTSLRTKTTAPIEADFDGLPAGIAAGGIMDLGAGRVYFRLADGTLRYLSLNAPDVPVNTVLPAITGIRVAGQTLTCSTGTWTNSPTGYAFQWRRGDAEIEGATGATYMLRAADEGQAVTCTVTATNATGSQSATSNTATPSATYAGVVSADNPVSYWRLGEASGTTAADAVGANPGTYSGGFTLGRDGALLGDANTAVLLDGDTGAVAVPASASLRLGDVFTLEAWVKRNDNHGGSFFYKGGNGFELADVGGGSLRFDKAGVSVIATATATFSSGSWHHIVATKDAAAVKLYVDGVDRTGPVTNATIQDTAGQLRMGGGNQPYFYGSIDEIAIYRTALSAARVAAHHAARG